MWDGSEPGARGGGEAAGARGGGEPPRADYSLKQLRFRAKVKLFARAWR